MITATIIRIATPAANRTTMISMIVGTTDDAVMRRPQLGQAAAEGDTW
jgi:hypothetical protein